MRSSLSNVAADPAEAREDAERPFGRAEQPAEDGFVLGRLALGAVGLACLPAYLVSHGAPAGTDVLVAAALAAPIPAAFLASRFGQRPAAYAVSAGGHALAAALLLWWSASFGWLALPVALAEPAQAWLRDRRGEAAAALVAAGTAAALVAFLSIAFPDSAPTSPLALAAALLFASAHVAMTVAALVARRAHRSGGRGSSATPGAGVGEDLSTALASAEGTAAGTAQAAPSSLDPKDHFLAAVSHELRTPLNAIIGFSEMLAEAQEGSLLDERRREYAGIIQESGTHLLGIVDTLLDVSRIKSGAFSIRREPTDLAAVIQACCRLLQPKADEARVRLDLRLAPGLPPALADRSAFRQIVLNLLSNAVKFTGAGGLVAVRLRQAGPDAILTVQDTGIGIQPDDLPRIGDPFFQGGNVYSRGREGTGLGFSVVRGLVDLHGGRVTIASAPGRGTTVTVVLPAWHARDHLSPPGRRAAPHRRPDLAA